MKKQQLEEFLSAEGFSAAEIAAFENLFEQVPGPHVQPAHKAQVLSTMLPLLPRRKTRLERFREWYPVALLTSQVSVLRREIWPASALVLLLGALATLTVPQGDALMFSALAPLVAAMGVAVLYNDVSQSMFEIEDATRTSAPILLLARLTLVFSFNLLFGLICSVFLVFFRSELLLSSLIMSWLAPMTFLSGLAFFLSVTTVDPLLSASSSLLLWLVHLLLRHVEGSSILLQLAAMPGLSDPAYRPMLMLAGVLLVAAVLWMYEVKNRREGKPL